MNLYQYKIDQSLVDIASSKAQDLGVLKNSIRNGEGNTIGFLGELVFMDFFGGIIINTYNWDIEINDRKVDIKTKSTTVEPQPQYLCSIPAANISQRCDSYYFIRINMRTLTAYLLGGLRKKTFFDIATFHKKGEEDPEGNGWAFAADCYNVPISKLKQPCKSLSQ